MDAHRQAFMRKHVLPGLAMLACAAVLSGCVSLGGAEPPERLITLTPALVAPAGVGGNGTVDQAITVLEPEASLRLDVMRVPVQVNPSTVAYLKDAVWVEKPARLFGRLLAESIRAKASRFVVEGADIKYAAATKLSGNLTEMGYHVASRSVVVRYDAMLQQADGNIRTQRFETAIPVAVADAAFVAPALNDAANQVAAQVADWVN